MKYGGAYYCKMIEAAKTNLGDISAALLAADARVKELEAALERERMRLAACGIAALGYFEVCHEDYISASLQDVLKLRSELVESRAEVEKVVEAAIGVSQILSVDDGAIGELFKTLAELHRVRNGEK